MVMKSSKRYRESCGPGLDSGWYWTEKTGSSLWRIPSRVWSFRLTWVTSKPSGQRRRVNRKAVVVRGYFDAARLQVLDRVVGAAVAEGQFVCPPVEGQGEQLVAEADAERREAFRAERRMTGSAAFAISGLPGPLLRKRPSG